MNFEIYGGFEIARDKKTRHGVFDKSFWKLVGERETVLPDACGCFVFVLKNGDNIVAWYIGKAERQSFLGDLFWYRRTRKRCLPHPNWWQ